MAQLKAANLAARFLLELCMLAALGFTGFQLGEPLLLKLALAVLLPLIAAIVWGLFVSPRARIAVPYWLWLAIQLLLFGLAIGGLVLTGQTLLGTVFGLVVAINIFLLVIWQQHDDQKAMVRRQ